MAVPTGCTQPAGVRIRLAMAINTICWRSLEDGINVAAGAGSGTMLAGQFECKLVMVDVCRPAFDGMAKSTVCAVLPVVLIVFLVAGGAIGRCTFENIVCMTILTGDTDMLAFQLESCQVMVDRGRSPAFGFMAGSAVSADPV